MIDLLKDNYMSGSGNGDTWYVDIQPPKKKVRSYFEETIEAAEYVYANKTGRIHLLYSGGMDSEYVFNIFLTLGFDFTPVIIRLNSNYNQHDLKYAFDFCESKGVTPTIVDVDFDEFVKSGQIVDLAQEMKCSAFQIPLTMHVANQLDGFIVMGNDPPYMKYNKETGIWQVEELELIHSILNNFRLKKLEGCPFFLSYTAEMMLSFLLEPRMANLAKGRYPGKLGTNSSKIHVYNNNDQFYMLPRTKYTGYEHIEELEIFQHPNIKIFEEFSKVWGGAHYEDYKPLVERLSLHQ